MPYQPELNLRTAISLVDEVTAQIEQLKHTMDQHNASLQDADEDNFRQSFTQALKGQFGIIREVNTLIQKCEQAFSLASSVKSSNPDMQLVSKIDGEDVEITPDMVIAHSHLCKGVISYLSGNLKDAQECFEQSLNVYPMADAQLRLAYTILGQGERNESLNAFQKVIDDYPDSDEAVEAKKTILQIERIKPKQWIVALLLSIFLGLFGADRFYLGYIKTGFIKLITGGGLYVWWIIDIFRIATNSLRDANGFKLEKTNKQTTIIRR